MQITYKAAYTLLDTFYIRRTLQGYINDYIPPNMFESSVLLAHRIEDYLYLDVMVSKKDYLSNKYAIFVKDNEMPIVLELDKDLSLMEFAILSTKTCIPVEEYKVVVESTADGKGESASEMVKIFEQCLSVVKELIEDKPVVRTNPKK